jgi:hypothetical protein
MRSNTCRVARRVTSIHAQPLFFCLPHGTCIAPIPIAARMGVSPVSTFFSAGAGARSGDPEGLAIAFGDTACLTVLANCG